MANPMIPPMDPRAMAAQGITNPFAPPPPPPPSPSLGFQVWASAPQNALLVQHAMTPPDQKLQPNAPPMASAMPPQQKFSALNPPDPTQGTQAPQLAGLQAPQEPAPQAAPAMPAQRNPLMPPGGIPNVQSQQQANLGTDQAELQRLQQTGAGVDQVHNKFGRIAGKVGDIASMFLLGKGAAAIPGTTAHNLWLQQQASGRVANDQDAISTGLANQTAQMNLEQMPQELAIKQQAASLKGIQAQGSLAQHGLKVQQNEDGTTSIVPDEDSEAYKTQQSTIAERDAQRQYITAGIQLRQAQAELAKVKADPNSPQFKQAQQRLAIAQQNAAAANERAKAYMGRYMQSAYNTGLDNKVLPGATQIADDQGNETVVGTGNASHAAKAQTSAAQFNDVHGALDTVENSARNLVKAGGALNSPGVSAALAQPVGTLGQWLQGEAAKKQLTPAERDYVLAVSQAHENIQALRKAAGGAATDAQVAKLDAMIPNASTPDIDYLMRQTEQIRATAERLGKGVSTAKGGLTVRGRNNMVPPTQPGSGPKEGDSKTNSAGDKIVFKGGQWRMQ